MAQVTTSFDTVIHVYQDNRETAIGYLSQYTQTPHPGSNKTIQGWRWDERVWPPEEEFEALAFAPTVWDPSTLGIGDDLWQSGYGDNKDLLLLGVQNVYEGSGINIWTPRVNHGHFYAGFEEWYLYSDYFQTEIFKLSNTISGQQYLDMKLAYKPTIPIQVRQFRYNKITGEHLVELDLRKVIEFNEVSGNPEFRVDTDYSPSRLWTDAVYSQEVGGDVDVVSGVLDLSTVSDLEFLGMANGDPSPQFNTTFSPIDLGESIEVWSWKDKTHFTEWTILSGLDEFTPGDNPEVRIDPNRGVVEFGDYNATENPGGAGRYPEYSERVAIRYTKTISALYEPLHTRDYILARGADVNPVSSSSYRGFVQVVTKIADPAYITLEADLPEGNPTYLIELGNNTGRLTATVYDTTGATIEGIEVAFEILYPEVGTFGAAQRTISAITNSAGEAKTIYNSPLTIEDVGQATDRLTGGNTILTVDGLTDPGTISGLWLYKIHEYDLALGIPEDEVDDYYQNYLDEEDITAGSTATQDYEEDWRTKHKLGKPTSYGTDELSVGKKTLVTTDGRVWAIDPHTGEHDSTTLVPLYPASIEDVGTENLPTLRLTYPMVLDGIGSNDTKAYFIVGDAKTFIRAYCTVERTRKRIYSNTIGMKVTIPATVNGTYFIDELNHSGLLTKARDIDDISDVIIEETSGIDSFWRAYQSERVGGRGFYSGPIDPEPLLDKVSFDGSYSTLQSLVSWDATGTTSYDKEVWIAGVITNRNSNPTHDPPFYGSTIVEEEGIAGDTADCWSAILERIVTSTGVADESISNLNPPCYSYSTTLATFRANQTTGATRVQSGSNKAETNSTCDVTLPSTVSEGNTLIAVATTLREDSVISELTSITLGSKQFTKAVEAEGNRSGDTTHCSIWYLDNVEASDGDTVTALADNSKGFITLLVIEYSGLEEIVGSAGDFEAETYIDWFRRTRKGDTLGFIEASETVTGLDPGLLSVDLIDAPGEIPLGFRLKSTGITIASMLDQITYLDPNDHLPSGYWDHEFPTSGGGGTP